MVINVRKTAEKTAEKVNLESDSTAPNEKDVHTHEPS
jgi:hypothetical protein